MPKSTKPKILVIDDDPHWVGIITSFLDEAGFEACGALDGREGLRRVYADKPDLILLDITMPGIDGFQVLDHIRLATDIPVVMLTAATEPSYEIQSFNRGAMDFIQKGTPKEVMIANIRSKLKLLPARRMPRGLHIVDDELTIDLSKRTVRFREKTITLAPKLWRVLECLVKKEGEVVSWEELMRAIWDEYEFRDQRAVKVLISKLRKKFDDNPKQPRYIHTVRDAGYMFDGRRSRARI